MIKRVLFLKLQKGKGLKGNIMNSCISKNLGNYEEMETFLEKHKLLKLTPEETENLNRFFLSEKFELLIQ